jgi:hypothetical protein
MDMRAIILLLAAACATGGSQYGTVAIKSFANAAAPASRFSVGRGSISGSSLKAALDDQGCIRGSVGGTPIQFCRDQANPNHWSGGSGDFTAVASPDGHSVNVDGYLMLDTRRQASMTQVVRLGDGPQWDELRRNPALAAIAATAADLEAAHIQH